MGQSDCGWSVSQIPQTEESAARHCTVGSRNESNNSANQRARAFGAVLLSGGVNVNVYVLGVSKKI